MDVGSWALMTNVLVDGTILLGDVVLGTGRTLWLGTLVSGDAVDRGITVFFGIGSFLEGKDLLVILEKTSTVSGVLRILG